MNENGIFIGSELMRNNTVIRASSPFVITGDDALAGGDSNDYLEGGKGTDTLSWRIAA